MKTVNILMWAMFGLLADIFKTLTYVFLIVYGMSSICELEVNPAIPVRGDGLLIASIFSGLMTIIFRLGEDMMKP